MRRSFPRRTWKKRAPPRADPWTAGNRPEVAERFGILDVAPTPEQAFRRRAWRQFRRDPETGLLPFGVA